MPIPNYQSRIANAQALMRSHGMEALLVFSAENLRYLTGYTGEAAYGVLASHTLHLITDYRFVEQANADCLHCTVICRDREKTTLAEVIGEVLGNAAVSRVAVESEHLSLDLFTKIQHHFQPITLVPINGIVEGLRACKDEWEVAQIRRAAQIADQALEALVAQIRLGVSERDLAMELAYLMRAKGADDLAFPIIIGFGENSAKPHCVPGYRALKEGDFVLIDFGAMINGYRSDMTRTFVAGEPTEQQLSMMGTVLRAQEAAIASTRAGVSGQQIDREARRIIDRSPFAHYAGKGLGHGVGLKLHEHPFLGQRCEDTLHTGFVVTIEPGIYIPGVGGVRYEDDVLVGEAGASCLTHAPKFFQISV
ncbi:M24 family metallopeptidase [Massilia mucilaginosa]|nr:Xaa-Pro peptidase family protein [Massilia mucilaginosa]